MASDSWFRFYNTAPDSPKVLLLTDAQFRAWVMLLSLASKLGGVIPGSIDLIAKTLRKPAQKAADTIQVLLSAGLLDATDAGYEPHNWNERQFKSDTSTPRVKRFRAKSRNVSETPQRQSTETESKKDTPAKAVVPPKTLLPDWIDKAAWEGFVEMRNRIRAPMTERAQALAIGELKRLANQGHDPTAVLDQSTQNAWKGLFKIKTDNANGKRSSPHETVYGVARDMCAEILAGGQDPEGGGADQAPLALLPARPN